MSDVHLHLLVNHIPVLGTLFSLVLGLYGAARRQPAVVRAAFLGLIVSGLGSLAATRTGDGAEEVVEDIAGVSEQAIHAHEEAAEIANYAAVALALLAMGALVWRRDKPDPGGAITGIVLVGAVVVFGLMARAGNLGGQIRHSEIRSPTVEVSSEAVGTDERGEHDERSERDD